MGLLPRELDTGPMKRTLIHLIAASLILTACGGGGSPAIDGTRAWFQALAELAL